jgi:hypothetical protein
MLPGPEQMLGEAGDGPDEEPGQTRKTGSLNSGLQSGRARIGLHDALKTTTRIARDNRRRDESAAQGLLRTMQ